MTEKKLDMRKYNFDEPIEYDHSKPSFVPAESLIKRSCYNDECSWEGMIGEDQRMCPACEAQIRGWKSRGE